jgi:hypothetical protein
VSTLRDLQTIFARAVTGASATDALEEQVAGTRERAHQRIEVYAEAYSSRLLEVLREDYPRVAKALGERFPAIMREYVREHPSKNPSLRHFGRNVPLFLAERAHADFPPWLSDLAQLEWARVEAFDAADRAPMTLEELQAVPADEWPRLRLELVPSVRTLVLSWPADEVWSALEEENSVPGRTGPRKTVVAVWRNGLVVRHRACDAAEARAVASIARRDPFAEICEAMVESDDADVAGAALDAVRLLRQWVVDGWIASQGAAPMPSRLP